MMSEIVDFILTLLIADTLMIFIPAGVLALIARMFAERWEDGCKRTDKEIHGRIKRVIHHKEAGRVSDTGSGETPHDSGRHED